MTPEEKAEQRRLDEELCRQFKDMTPEEMAEFRWIEAELLRRLDADFIRDQAAAAQPLDIALDFAERGDLERLRKMYPRLARFIKPPKRRMGPPKKPAITSDKSFRARAAYADARRIRAIWRERAGRTVHRVCGHLAQWYAAKLWDLEVEDDVEAGRPSGPGGPKKKTST